MRDHGMPPPLLLRLRYIDQATKSVCAPARTKHSCLPRFPRKEASTKCRRVTKEIVRSKMPLGGSAGGSDGSRTRPTHRSIVAAF